MKKAYSLYLRTTDNVGDKKASPADHFSFPIEVEKLCVHDCFGLDLSESFLILGGGGLVHSGALGERMEYLETICKLSPYMVTWGIGHNIHGTDKLEYPDYFLNSFMSHGVRDYRQSILPWVPCASCMHQVFDRKYDVRRTYSVTGHNLASYRSLHKLPKMEHTKANFEDCIEFLATGQYVVTNSYHGAYWGALLGKKVVVFDPFSSKFFYMFDNIAVASPDTWVDSLSLAEPDDSLLELCRIRSRQYFKNVYEMMEDYLRL